MKAIASLISWKTKTNHHLKNKDSMIITWSLDEWTIPSYSLKRYFLKPIDLNKSPLNRPHCIRTTGSSFPIITKRKLENSSFIFKYHGTEESVDRLSYHRLLVPEKGKSNFVFCWSTKQTLGNVEGNGSHVDRAKTPANGCGVVNAERRKDRERKWKNRFFYQHEEQRHHLWNVRRILIAWQEWNSNSLWKTSDDLK